LPSAWSLGVVAFEQRLERIAPGDRRVRCGQLAHPVDQEEHLHRHRLLAPQRAVVVERRDPLGFGNVVGGRFRSPA
jgi:hypothetical protein